MRKVLALSYMMGCSLALAAGKALPGIVAILLFSVTPAGVFQTFFGGTLGIASTLFGYFVSNQFPTSPPSIGDWIMGL